MLFLYFVRDFTRCNMAVYDVDDVDFFSICNCNNIKHIYKYSINTNIE